MINIPGIDVGACVQQKSDAVAARYAAAVSVRVPPATRILAPVP